MITVVYNLTISAAIAVTAYILVQQYKDTREHILGDSELRQAALSYIGDHCSGYTVADGVTAQQLIDAGHLEGGFNDHGVALSMNLANYPHAILEADGNSRFKTYLDSLDMGKFEGVTRQNRFSPDTGMYRVTNAGLNFQMINGYNLRCEEPATRAELWNTLCAGLAFVNDGMECNNWSEE